MAYCNPISLAGVNNACATSIGGVSDVWITPYADDLFSATTLENVDAIDSITALTTGHTWYHYIFAKGTTNLTNAGTIDVANGIKFVDTTLSMIFSKQDAEKRLEVSALLLGQVAVIVKDNNGKYQYLGSQSPVEVSENGGQLGQARTDGNNYTISLLDTTSIYPPFLADSAIENLKQLTSDKA